MNNPFDDVELSDDGTEALCACVLVLDTSSSMNGAKIRQLNAGLRTLETTLKQHTLARIRVELAIVTFGGVVEAINVRSGKGEVIGWDHSENFTIVEDFYAPELVAKGSTPMGEAVQRASKLLRDRKNYYRESGIDYYRPWMIVITDGLPTDHDQWKFAALEIQSHEAERKGLLFFGIGVEGANLETLAEFSMQRRPLMLSGLKFEELFTWVSNSLISVSGSRPGDKISLPPRDGWEEIAT